jgi:hypothetical protein
MAYHNTETAPILEPGTNITMVTTDKVITISASGGGTPGGSDTQVQFNDASSFGGDAGLVYNKTTDILTVAGGVIVTAETASRIASFDGSKQVKALDTATYPSLTELALVKGVTSPIQPQLDGKSSVGSSEELGASFDGMGSVVLVNSIAYQRVKYAKTITGWSIMAEGTSPTCTIDIFKIATGTTLPTSSICASALPALATGNALKSTTLTGWTTSIADDDMLAFKVTACSAAIKITIKLYP